MFRTEQNRTCYITCVMLCYMTYVHNRTERNMLYNMCHVMLYDICLKQNRTCAHVSYYTPGVMLCYITYDPCRIRHCKIYANAVTKVCKTYVNHAHCFNQILCCFYARTMFFENAMFSLVLLKSYAVFKGRNKGRNDIVST